MSESEERSVPDQDGERAKGGHQDRGSEGVGGKVGDWGRRRSQLRSIRSVEQREKRTLTDNHCRGREGQLVVRDSGVLSSGGRLRAASPPQSSPFLHCLVCVPVTPSFRPVRPQPLRASTPTLTGHHPRPPDPILQVRARIRRKPIVPIRRINETLHPSCRVSRELPGRTRGTPPRAFLVMMKLVPIARELEMASASPIYLSRWPSGVMGRSAMLGKGAKREGDATREGQGVGGRRSG